MTCVNTKQLNSSNRLAVAISVISLIIAILSAILLFWQTLILERSDKERNAADLCRAFITDPVLSGWRDELQAIQVRRDRVLRSSLARDQKTEGPLPPPVCTGTSPGRTLASWESEARDAGADHEAAREDARRFRRLVGNLNNHLEVVASLWHRDKLNRVMIASCMREEAISFREISINCLNSPYEATYPDLAQMLSSNYFVPR